MPLLVRGALPPPPPRSMAARGSASSAWGGAPSAARPAVADLVATRRAQRVARAEDCLRGAGTIVLYLLVGPALMILNKEILSPSVGFPYPMMLSSFGLLLCSALAHGAAALGLFAPRQRATRHVISSRADRAGWSESVRAHALAGCSTATR